MENNKKKKMYPEKQEVDGEEEEPEPEEHVAERVFTTQKSQSNVIMK